MRNHWPVLRVRPIVRSGGVGALVVILGCGSPAGLAPGPASAPAIEAVRPPVASRDADGGRAWFDAAALRLEGKGWTQTERPYDRLPAAARRVVREAVWNLSRHSAGLCVRFVTDARRITAAWSLTSKNLSMPHMPATGVSGLDLYVRCPAGWWWVGAGRPLAQANETVLLASTPPGMHEYLLYLPLYNGTESLRIGVPLEALMARPPARPHRPVVFYGTSITQGGCASRPGMAYPAILGRRLDREMINLGFSGNGRMDPDVADLIARIDADAYVLDCLPNMKMDMVADRVEPFVRALRAARPDTPIVLVESIPYPAQEVAPNPESGAAAQNRLLREIHGRLAASGVKNLYLMPGADLYGHDGEATVDGCHASDLGFFRFADALEPLLQKILRGPRPAAG